MGLAGTLGAEGFDAGGDGSPELGRSIEVVVHAGRDEAGLQALVEDDIVAELDDCALEGRAHGGLDR